MPKNHSRERGQILVLMVVGLVGLLGFIALAIDGGMILSDRRYDQAAADAASLAGAGSIAQALQAARISTMNFDCTAGDVVAARNAAPNIAVSSAATNGFTIDTDIADSNGVVVVCNAAERSIDVQVMITQKVSTSFAQMFYKGDINNTVESVATVYPMRDIGFGNTIVGLDTECAPGNKVGVTMDGSSSITIKSGGVWSNSCLNATGTKLKVTVEEGGITYDTDFAPFKESGDPDISPDPETVDETIPKYDGIEVDCDDDSLGNFGSMKIDATDEIEPGNYTGITVNNKDTVLTMKPGLYCLTGDFTLSGGSIIGNGVTIYMQKDGAKSTNLEIGGNAGAATKNQDLGTIQLTAPTSACTSSICPPAIKGLLVYMAFGNEGKVTLQGNSSSVFNGTVYAPDGEVNLGGTSSDTTSMGVQVLANTVKIHGNVDLDVFTDADSIFLIPASLSHTQ